MIKYPLNKKALVELGPLVIRYIIVLSANLVLFYVINLAMQFFKRFLEFSFLYLMRGPVFGSLVCLKLESLFSANDACAVE